MATFKESNKIGWFVWGFHMVDWPAVDAFGPLLVTTFRKMVRLSLWVKVFQIIRTT